jgi:hypothetical protein
MNRKDSDSTGLRNGAWHGSLNGAFAIIATCATVAWLWAVCGASWPPEATVQLAQSASRLEHARSVHPNTDLERKLALPRDDCGQTACSPDLLPRNSAVRARLKALIAMKAQSDTFAAASGDVIAAGPVQFMEPR